MKNNMVLNNEKAKELLLKIEEHCKKKGIKIDSCKSVRRIWIAKEIIKRYHGVVLEECGVRYLCNNPKYLKKWAFRESLKKVDPLKLI